MKEPARSPTRAAVARARRCRIQRAASCRAFPAENRSISSLSNCSRARSRAVGSLGSGSQPPLELQDTPALPLAPGTDESPLPRDQQFCAKLLGHTAELQLARRRLESQHVGHLRERLSVVEDTQARLARCSLELEVQFDPSHHRPVHAPLFQPSGHRALGHRRVAEALIARPERDQPCDALAQLVQSRVPAGPMQDRRAPQR